METTLNTDSEGPTKKKDDGGAGKKAALSAISPSSVDAAGTVILSGSIPVGEGQPERAASSGIAASILTYVGGLTGAFVVCGYLIHRSQEAFLGIELNVKVPDDFVLLTAQMLLDIGKAVYNFKTFCNPFCILIVAVLLVIIRLHRRRPREQRTTMKLFVILVTLKVVLFDLPALPLSDFLHFTPDPGHDFNAGFLTTLTHLLWAGILQAHGPYKVYSWSTSAAVYLQSQGKSSLDTSWAVTWYEAQLEMSLALLASAAYFGWNLLQGEYANSHTSHFRILLPLLLAFLFVPFTYGKLGSHLDFPAVLVICTDSHECGPQSPLTTPVTHSPRKDPPADKQSPKTAAPSKPEWQGLRGNLLFASDSEIRVALFRDPVDRSQCRFVMLSVPRSRVSLVQVDYEKDRIDIVDGYMSQCGQRRKN